MAHLLDELLLFHRELTLLHYPSAHPSPLAVLLADVPFHKWVSMEKQCKEEEVEEEVVEEGVGEVKEAEDEVDGGGCGIM